MGISKAKMDELRNNFGGMCKKCGSKRELQFAHVLPTKLCGKNSRGSQARHDDILKHPLAYVLLCRKCHDKTGPSVYAMREMRAKKKGF